MSTEGAFASRLIPFVNTWGGPLGRSAARREP